MELRQKDATRERELARTKERRGKRTDGYLYSLESKKSADARAQLQLGNV